MRTIPLLAGRWRPALFGAAAGLLAAVALIIANVPLGERATPAVVVSCGTIAGLIAGACRWWRIAGWIAVGLAAATSIVALTPVMDGPMQRWIRADAIPPEPLDAVVVLSGGMTHEGLLTAPSLERLLSGLGLMHANHARLLVTTRDAVPDTRPPVTSERDQRAIIGMSIDTSLWRIVGPVASTRDEAVKTAALLPPAIAGRIAVVSSPMHSRRACAIFEALGYRVVCVPSEARSYSIRELTAGAPRFHAFIDWLYEHLAMIKYRRRGWIRS